MMVLSTDDVKRLKNKFVRPLSVDEFVFIMIKCLHDHIHNEVCLEFVMSVIELYETIDVNGDGSLEWDEFAGYGLPRHAEEAIVAQSTIKLYSPLVFKGGAANSIQPMVADRTYIQQVAILAGRQALAYFEHGSDVVHIYLFGHDRDAEPRFASTIRLHTAYQAHKVLCIEDIATRSSLAISSLLTMGCITLWDVTRLYNPIPLQRIDLTVPQETLTWVPSHQLLLVATTQSTYKKASKKQHPFAFVTAFDIATLERVPLDVGIKHVTSLCVVKRSTRTAVALGSMDGTITVHDMAKESQQRRHDIVVDAHEKGVKALAYSVKFGYLASIGHYSFAEESTMEVLVWHFDDGDNATSTVRLDRALSGHHAASVEFHDCALVREREDFLFVDFNATFNVILAATYHRLILWDLATGDVRKTYELHVIYHGRPAHSITAVCLDDRERKLIVGDDVGQVLVVNVVNGNLMKELDPHAQAVRVMVFAGDEAGEVVRWTLSYSAVVESGLSVRHSNNTDDNDDGDDASAETTFVTAVPAARPSTAKRNSTPTLAPAVASAAPANPGRHTHVDVTWDTMSKSIRTAKLSTIAAPPQSVGSDVQWQVDGGAITKLARAICTEDKLTIFTCVATGKIQAWSVDGNDQGTLDYFATRRQPANLMRTALMSVVDVVLHDIGKLNHVTRSTHARKKRTIHTVDSIMERSISMPALPPKAAASIKPDKPIKVKVPSKHLLPPLDLRQEMADLALLKQQEAATNSPDADNPSTLSVLSYHLKLAHAWQQ
ncbi:hypothetical protein DYB32_008225 [Aphanomyces invadans]|uniref:Uncharacterized protein n=1 Tax=Aphanomyces invadans TaxID=157072 RepID=A0A3R6YU77_9STRA|nr:hypothetical protein DYB32_008225 [Aphanomyces invadans]